MLARLRLGCPFLLKRARNCSAVKSYRHGRKVCLPLATRDWPLSLPSLQQFSTLEGANKNSIEKPELRVEEKEEEEKENVEEKPIVPIVLRAPDDGANHQVTVSEWYKSEGDEVEAGEAICEIDSPEFSYDYQTSVSGVVAKIIARTGTSDIEPGDTLAYLAESAEALEGVLNVLEKEEAKKKELAEALNESSVEAEAIIDSENVSDEELLSWLKNVREDFAVKYAKLFKEEGFDSKATIETITEDDLKQMDIKTGHLRLLLKHIQALQTQNET